MAESAGIHRKARRGAPAGMEAAYRAAFACLHDAAIITDGKGVIRRLNRAAREIFGLEEGVDILGPVPQPAVFQDPQDMKRLLELADRRGGTAEMEARLTGKGGRIIEARLTAQRVSDKRRDAVAWVFVIRDLSVLRRTMERVDRLNTRLSALHSVAMTASSSLNLEEVLQRTIRKILEILDAASVRVYMLDPQGEHLELVAYEGLSAHFVTKSYFKRRRVGDGLLGKTVQTRETRVVNNFLRADDPYVDSIIEEGLRSSVYIPLIAREKPVGALCVSSHSEYKFSKAFVEFLANIGNQIGLAIENANLYESVKKAYQELSEAQEQVVQTEKLASLGKLAATIAHEINNPLSVVLTYIKLMRKLADRGAFKAERLDDISRYLDTMEMETSRCGESVKNLLAFSRQSKLDIDRHRIEEIIDRTLTLIMHELEIKEMQLETRIEPDLPWVLCDFRQIQQALLNLMINATEAMEKGGLLGVTARSSKKKGFVEIIVSDTGCGIPRRDLKHIFEPFYTTKEEAKGVGLGLAVVYGIVSRHGGEIQVTSEVGKGSAFEIRLPAAP